MELNLYDYQVKNIEHLREQFSMGHRAQMFYAATGFGKTECAIALMDLAAKKGKNVAMVMDRRILVSQTSDRLDRYGIDHGVIMAKHWRYSKEHKIQICSAQTLEAMGSVPDIDLLIIDEAHCTRKSLIEFIKRHPSVKVIGLSASPFTKGLGKIYSAVSGCTTTKQLVEEHKKLAPLRVFVAKEINMKGAKKVAGEWSQSEATKRGIVITGDIVNEWIKKTHDIFGKPVKTAVFCAGVAHGLDLQKKFQAAGYNFISISYKDDDDFKAKAIAEFAKPDSTIMGLIATDIITKGWDCIAEGSLINTNHGLIAIEKLSLNDKVWDGYDYVDHSGAIYKGEKDVITYCGLTATPDHKVKTLYGWLPFEFCAKKQITIITTGNGRETIQEHDNYFTGINKKTGEITVVKRSLLSVRMCKLWKPVRHCQKLVNQWKNFWMSKMRRKQSNSSMDCIKMQTHANAMSKPFTQALQKLWWAWDRIQVRVATSLCGMDNKKYRNSEARQKCSARQNKQQWSLRSREYPMGWETSPGMQFTQEDGYGNDAQVQNESSRNKICRQNIKESIFDEFYIGNDNREVLSEIRQTKRRVWDILNAGPRNSFTCNGLLVHNCPDVTIGISARPFTKSFSSHTQQMGRLMRPFPNKEYAVWIDHSGNFLRFRDQWEDLYENGVSELDDGAEKPKPEPTDKEKKEATCPVCGCLWSTKTDICPNCGHVRVRLNAVQTQQGELVELTKPTSKPKKEDQYSSEYKERFYQGLLGYARSRGIKDGWAFYKYHDKFKVNPPWKKEARPPDIDVINFIKYQQIKYAKSKK